MDYSKEEIKEIEELRKKYPVVEKLWFEICEYKENPAYIYHQSITKIVKKLAKDVDDAIDTSENVFTNKTKDDKTFERFMLLVTGGEKGFKALRIGKGDIDPEGAEKEKRASEEENDTAF